LSLRPSSHRFRFADTIIVSSGRLRVNLPTRTRSISFFVHVVDADIPLLLGLDFLDRHRLDVLVSESKLLSRLKVWNLALKRHHNQLFII
jgi:hypothetical protein